MLFSSCMVFSTADYHNTDKTFKKLSSQFRKKFFSLAKELNIFPCCCDSLHSFMYMYIYSRDLGRVWAIRINKK